MNAIANWIPLGWPNTVPAGGEDEAPASTWVRRTVVGRRERRGRLEEVIDIWVLIKFGPYLDLNLDLDLDLDVDIDLH